MWAVIIVYAAIIAIAKASVLMRREVRLLTGSTLRNFCSIFAVLGIVGLLLSREPAMLEYVAAGVMLAGLVVSLIVGERWLLFRYDADQVSTVLEQSMARILLNFKKTTDGYVATLRDGKEVTIRMSPLVFNSAALTFHGHTEEKKVDVLRSLVRKAFPPVFPRPVIHL